MNQNLSKILKMGMLCAIAVVLVAYAHFPIFPQANYLLYDPADVLLLIGAFLFGPVAGLAMTVVTALLQSLLISPEAGWVGFVMHVLASGTLVMVAGSIYKIKKTRGFATLGLAAGVFAMAAIMVPANLIFTVNFYGVPYGTMVGLLPVTIAFNLIKAAANAVLVFLIYKPIGMLLRLEHRRTAPAQK